MAWGTNTVARRDSAGLRLLRRGIAGLVSSVAVGVFGVLLLVAGTRWLMPATIQGPVADGGWTARTRAWVEPSGFYEPELDSATSKAFSWTGRVVRLDLAALDRSHPYVLTLELVPWRPAGLPPARLHAAVDGVMQAPLPLPDGSEGVALSIPSRHTPGAVIGLEVSDTFVPGSHDKRELGVIVRQVGLSPAGGHFQPSLAVAVKAGLAIAACAFGLFLCGLRSRQGVLVHAVVAAGFSWLLLQDGAFIGTYVDRLIAVGAGVAVVGAIVAIARWRWPVVAGLPEWSIAVGLVLAASAVKLALFAHPLATIGDAIFQVHRAQMVHGGNYFFTSITPRPFFEFPYPIALYVVAQPFWRYFPSEIDLVRLLRGLTLAADALVGLVLYAAARRQWNDRVTALLCAVLWPLARAPFEGLSNANLTNVFGQAIFGVGMGLIAWTAAGKRTSIGGMVAVCGLLAVAFLSHFGTVSAGLPILCAVGVMLWAGGRTNVRRLGPWVLIVALAAGTLSYAVYYSHFTPIYRTTIARVLSREGEAPTRSMVAPPGIRLRRWLAGGSDDYGLPSLPTLLVALTGAGLLVRRRRREGVTLVLSGWALAWAVFAVLGIFSALTVRVNLATAPVFVCLCAYALGSLWARSRLAAALAAAGTLVIAWDGLRIGLTCLGLSRLL
jgi:hypothetical protein